MKSVAAFSIIALSLSFGVWAQNANDSILPPAPAWPGKSRELALAPDHEWATPFERSGLKDSPGYDETVAWLKRLAEASPELSLTGIGKSWQGRDIVMVVASKERSFGAGALKASGKPLLLAQGGIHSGEIDGKDAGMMLLRDMTVTGTKKALLDHANFLFIPILNVDGHERSSPHNRINQRGPRTMGWRTNARNLNLNRDYAKLETPEVRAVVSVINRFSPDLYLDLHVTDGIDYQYDITFGATGPHGHSPAIATWIRDVLTPSVNRNLSDMGHIPGPLIFGVNNTDLSQGIVQWTGSPRYSDSYGDARHLPTILVENHSLKSFDQRVLGTYVFLEGVMKVLGGKAEALEKAIRADRERRPERVSLTFKPEEGEPETIAFLGIEHRQSESEISGGTWVQWLGKPVTVEVPFIKINQPNLTVSLPKAYWIPPTWPEVIEKLEQHGVSMERIYTAREVPVEMYRFEDPQLENSAFEGRIQVMAKAVPEKRRETFPPGSARVSTDQPLAELIVLLLEPDSPDSLFQWGYFHEILQRTEYFESYALEPLSRQMLAQDPELKKAFEARLKEDEEFAKSPRRRLDWFYRRSPYVDERYLLYPIAREH